MTTAYISNVSAPTDAEVLKYVTGHLNQCLQYADPDGRIDMDGVKQLMIDSRNKKIIEEHEQKYPIKQLKGSDTRYSTQVRDITKKDNRRKIRKATREEVEEWLIRWYQTHNDDGLPVEPASDSLTFYDVFQRWQDWKAKYFEPTTVERDQRTWKQFFIGNPIINWKITRITHEELRKWQNQVLADTPMTGHQYTNFHTIVNGVFCYARDELEIIPFNPYDGVNPRIGNRSLLKPTPPKKSSEQTFTDEEIRLLWEVAKAEFENPPHQLRHLLTPLAVMFMTTGVVVRIGEVCGLRYGDIDGVYWLVQRRVRMSDKGQQIVPCPKGQHHRITPLPPSALELIKIAKDYQIRNNLPADGFVFSTSTEDEPISYDAIEKAIHRYCKKAGIPYRSSHKFRKTGASRIKDQSGISDRTLCDWMGIKDETILYNNYHFDRSSESENYREFANLVDIGMSVPTCTQKENPLER